jgi:putative ABC transport system permease protein
MKSLPLDYAIRNLARRPLRTALAGLSTALAAALVTGAAAFVGGLDRGFGGAAAEDAAILISSVAERDVVRSTVTAGLPGLVAANVRGIRSFDGVPAVSGELHFGTYLRLGDGTAAGPDPAYQAFVRGVTPRAFLVHDAVTLVAGRPPRTGEAIVGRLAADKLGVPADALALGRKVRFEGQTFEIVGAFAAPGTTIESELWAPVEELKGLTKRDDLSVVFCRLESPEAFDELEIFAKRRLDLELVAIPSSVYYKELAAYLAPIGRLAWLLAGMIAAAALFGGANALNAAVQDRIRELATLRAVGYGAGAVLRSLLVESIVLAAAGGLGGLLVARVALSGVAVRIAMGAFALRVDAAAAAAGAGTALLLGVLGAVPAAIRVGRLSVAAALKES